MEQLPTIFRRFNSQFLHMIVLPIFFFVFMAIHRSARIEELLGHEFFGTHLAIISSIILLTTLALRLLYFFIEMKLNYSLYVLWCLGEIIFTSIFVAFYLWYMLHREMTYLELFATSYQYLFFTLIFPYVILGLSFMVYDYRLKSLNPDTNAAQRMRFYDNMHNLKIVLMPHTVLYIAADQNYVSIYYIDNGKVSEYVLRSSMKAIDEICQDNGLVRCHRSYYINPTHVRVLRKDKDGIMYAELDADDVRHIPVSKTYHNRLSEML